MPAHGAGSIPAFLAALFLVVSGLSAAPAAASAPVLRLPDHPAPVGVLPGDLIGMARGAVPATETVPVSITVRGADARGAVTGLVASLGGKVRRARGSTIEAVVPAGGLAAIGTDRHVEGVTSLLRPFTMPFTSRVAQTVGANAWVDAGIGGAGVRIGILDDFEGIEDLLGDEIPNTVHVRCSASWASPNAVETTVEACADRWDDEHGTAVVETIASVAPQAELFLAQPTTYLATADAIDWFAAEGVRIVSASFASGAVYEGPGDGTYDETESSHYGLVDHAVSHGMLWVNAAGNQADGVYSAMFAGGGGNTKLHDFATGGDVDRIWLEKGESAFIALRWDDSWKKPLTDLDIIVYEEDRIWAVDDSSDTNAETGQPTESLIYTADMDGWYGIAVALWSGPPARFELFSSTDLESHTDTPSLAAPVDSRNEGMIAAGAVRVDYPKVVEYYSSHGPTVDGRRKPDVVAPDCGITVTYGPFCGTSQSAPVTAGVAALLLAADPAIAGPAALADAVRASTRPVPLSTEREVGAGLVHVGPVPSPPPPPPPGPVALSLQVPSKPVTWSTPVVARVSAPDAAGREARIEAWRDGTWALLASATLDDRGEATIAWKAVRTDLVRASLAPLEGMPPGETEPRTVVVAATMKIVADTPGRDIPAGTVVRYTVKVGPPTDCSCVPTMVVQVRFGNDWEGVATRFPDAGKGDTWTFDVRWTRGLWRILFEWGPDGVEPARVDWTEVNAR